jgi:RHS repeat-associated protein
VGGKRDDTGTMYRRARYYDPQTGRFTQEDPIGLAGGLNLYGYAGGDPVNYADPSGQSPILIGAGIGAVIGAGVYLATTPPGQRSWGGFAGYTAGGALIGGTFGLGVAALIPASGAGGTAGTLTVVAVEGEAASILVQASAAARVAAANINNFTVSAKHLATAAGKWAKFQPGVNINAAIQEALLAEGALFSPNNVAGSFRIITDLGRVIGTKGQTAIKIVVDYTGKYGQRIP